MTRSQDWEQFRLWLFLKGGYSAIQTIGGNFVTAAGGGGQTTDALHTNATQIQAWERFQFSRITNLSNFHGSLAISTINGNFLTAVGGGGQTTNALRTVAGTIGDWEAFRLVKCGELGSGQMWPWPYLSTYNLLPVTGGVVFTWGAQGTNAEHYYGIPSGVIRDEYPESLGDLKINPIRQADGFLCSQSRWRKRDRSERLLPGDKHRHSVCTARGRASTDPNFPRRVTRWLYVPGCARAYGGESVLGLQLVGRRKREVQAA